MVIRHIPHRQHKSSVSPLECFSHLTFTQFVGCCENIALFYRTMAGNIKVVFYSETTTGIGKGHITDLTVLIMTIPAYPDFLTYPESRNRQSCILLENFVL